jgi:hypothetical protein
MPSDRRPPVLPPRETPGSAGPTTHPASSTPESGPAGPRSCVPLHQPRPTPSPSSSAKHGRSSTPRSRAAREPQPANGRRPRITECSVPRAKDRLIRAYADRAEVDVWQSCTQSQSWCPMIRGKESRAGLRRRVSSLRCGPRRDLSASVLQGPAAVRRTVEFGDYGDGRTQQRDLYSGIAGTVRNQVTNKQNSPGPSPTLDVGEHCVALFYVSGRHRISPC